MSGSHWNKKGIGCGKESDVTNLNSIALGLRTLRLHGYTMFSGIHLDPSGYLIDLGLKWIYDSLIFIFVSGYVIYIFHFLFFNIFYLCRLA